jgi:hypothetical protein
MTVPVFNLKVAGRKRIRDRGINWKEMYHEKSKSLKKRFDKSVGPGSYYRWEGHDVTTNSNYYVVVGPTIQSDLGKCFFAGIKKLPKDPKAKVYSPDGEYFTNIRSALSFAANKWGVRMPPNQINYTKQMLEPIDIPEHIKG